MAEDDLELARRGALVGERGAVVRVGEGLRALALEELRVLGRAAGWRRRIWLRTAAGSHGARRGGVQRWLIEEKEESRTMGLGSWN